MSKQKGKKNKCDKLKANVKKLKQEWRDAETAEAKLHKKYRKQYKKFKALLAPYREDWRAAKKDSDQHKKKYKAAKKKFATTCQPILMGEVMVVWKAPDSVEVKKEKTSKTTVVAKKKKTADKAKKNKVTKVKPSKETPSTVTPPAPPAPTTTTDKKVTLKSAKDDLKKIEGIGPKIEQLLNAANIHTFKHLAEAQVEKLQHILTEAGSRFRMHKPDTWSRQAKIAAEGSWEDLKAWQDKLKSGRE